MKKRNLFFLTILLIAASLTGCSNSNDVSVSNSSKITVIEKTDTKFFSYEWNPVNETTAIENADLIARGKVLGTKEIRIDFIEDATKMSEYKTIVDFKVSKVFYSNEGLSPSDKNISVILPISSYNWEQMAFEMNKDNEYIIFASNIKGNSINPMKLHEVASYAVKDPRNFIIDATSSVYEFSNIFESLKKGSERKDKLLGVTEPNLKEFVHDYGFLDDSKKPDSNSIEKDLDKSSIKGEKFEDAQSYLQKLQNTFIRKDKNFESDLSELIKRNGK